MKSHGKSKAVIAAVIFEVNLLQSSRFGDTLSLGVLFYQPKKESLCFFLYISEMGMELAGSEQIIVQDFMMLL